MRINVAPCVAALAALAGAAGAQTDWYNTDRGRPLRTEDAVVLERHAFEFQMTPIAAHRAGTRTTWEAEPELAWGFARRTQMAVGVPLLSERTHGSSSPIAAAGVHLTITHALNAETLGVPAIGLSATAIVPTGGRSGERAAGEVAALFTRTSAHARAHLNVRARVGSEDAGADIARWTAGLAADRPIALRSVLLAAEVTAEEPDTNLNVVWRFGAGVRVQLSPRVVLDAGIGRTATGAERGWSMTAGSAVAFAIPALQMRGVR